MTVRWTKRRGKLPAWFLVAITALTGGLRPLEASDYEPTLPFVPDAGSVGYVGSTAQSGPFEETNGATGAVPFGTGEEDSWPSPLSENGWEWENGDNRRLDLGQNGHRGPLGYLLRERPWIVDGPVVPEPMVFDMVRPMHARKGELEANVLGVVPLHRRHAALDWAPEIEYAIADGFGVEFEFPFLDENLEALKFAVQYTFDVGLENRLIHGYHGIYEYLFDGQISEMTSLYLMGIRFNDTWSVMGMFGFRSSVLAATGTHFTELLQNVGFFADITDTFIVGVETNMSHELAGPSRLLIVPQAHWQLNENLNLQFGFGLDASAERTYAIHAFRLVWER